MRNLMNMNKPCFGKSVVREMTRKISKKEVDDVLKEWAEARILGRRAVACIPNIEKNAVLVMPTKEYEAYTEAVVFAGFPKWAWDKDAATESIKGMKVVVDDKADKIRVCPNDLPKQSVVDLQKIGILLWGDGRFSCNSYSGLRYQAYEGLGGVISIGLILPSPFVGDDKAVEVRVMWVELIPIEDRKVLSNETMRKTFPIHGGEMDENALVLCIREVERQLKRNEWMEKTQKGELK